MAALAGVGSYGIVFRTKIVRSSRRACNFMIPKGECAPAVFSIPIARSTFLAEPAWPSAGRDEFVAVALRELTIEPSTPRAQADATIRQRALGAACEDDLSSSRGVAAPAWKPDSLANRAQIIDGERPELRTDARIIRSPGPELVGSGYRVLPCFALSRQR